MHRAPYHLLSPPLRTFALFSTEEAEQLYVDHGAFLPYEQIVAPTPFERLFSAVGENSIDFLKILYRLFSETL